MATPSSFTSLPMLAGSALGGAVWGGEQTLFSSAGNRKNLTVDYGEQPDFPLHHSERQRQRGATANCSSVTHCDMSSGASRYTSRLYPTVAMALSAIQAISAR